jgi:hypothetical protein
VVHTGPPLSADYYNLISLDVKIVQRQGHASVVGLLYCLQFIIFNLLLDLHIYVPLISSLQKRFHIAAFEGFTAVL